MCQCYIQPPGMAHGLHPVCQYNLVSSPNPSLPTLYLASRPRQVQTLVNQCSLMSAWDLALLHHPHPSGLASATKTVYCSTLASFQDPGPLTPPSHFQSQPRQHSLHKARIDYTFCFFCMISCLLLNLNCPIHPLQNQLSKGLTFQLLILDLKPTRLEQEQKQNKIHSTEAAQSLTSDHSQGKKSESQDSL